MLEYVDIFDDAPQELPKPASGFESRPYQEEAIANALRDARAGLHPVCCLPTGAGKSYVIARLCEALDGRILVVTHRAELIAQNSRNYNAIGATDFGIYSSELKRREVHQRIIFGSINSIYNKYPKLTLVGKFNHIIVDEAHLCTDKINKKDAPVKSMYNTLFSSHAGAIRVGMTATPYRLNTGAIFGDEKRHWFTHLAIDVRIRDLIDQGYLCHPKSFLTAVNVPLDKIKIRNGDFALEDLSDAMTEEEVLKKSVEEILTIAENRKSILIFCVDIKHCLEIHGKLSELGYKPSVVTGQTKERSKIFNKFKNGETRFLIGCEVFTTGFDAPNVDCIAILRPTQSKGLLVQIIGRGTRKHPSKEDCLILDLAGNMARHAPLDGLFTEHQKSKRLEDEEELKKREEKRNREKSEESSSRKRPLYAASTIDPLLATKIFEVEYLSYQKQRNQKGDKNTIRLIYNCKDQLGMSNRIYFWLCPEHNHRSPAYHSAKRWFERRGSEVPQDLEIDEWQHLMTKPKYIYASKADGFYRIHDEIFSIDDFSTLFQKATEREARKVS